MSAAPARRFGYYLFANRANQLSRQLVVSVGNINPRVTEAEAVSLAEELAELYYDASWNSVTLRLSDGTRYYIGRQITRKLN